MNGFGEASANHPLFRELRNGLLWHCTNVARFRLILADGLLRPVEGLANRWGNRPYACQTLGAICLFDFTTESEERVLGAANRWWQFVCSERPVTVILGMDKRDLPGKLVRYPENRDITPSSSTGPIPWVEVCHTGCIPLSAVGRCLLVCSVNTSRFKVCPNLNAEILTGVELEFEEVIRIHDEARASQFAKIQAQFDSPEFKDRLEQARLRLDEIRNQK